MEGKASFNLIDEPWICVRDDTGVAKEVSLLELFRQAPRLQCLANDLPTQDFAILRVLLAILQRAISPTLDDLDEDVGPAEVWGRLWEASELPMDAIEAYLAKWRDRFDLFDPRHPFMQVPDLRTSKDEWLPVAKIIADVPDGDRLFASRSSYKLDYLTFAEAARWLVHVQAFDTAGIKSGVVGDPTMKDGKSYPRGTGWAGSLGGIFIEGDTFRDTLLLNLIVRGDGDNEVFPDDDLPAWEQPLSRYGSLDKMPTGRADIFTWQSRRARLVVQQGAVVGLVLTNGDKLESKNMHRTEPMTAWRRSPNQEKKLHQTPIYLPATHRSNRALWRGLSSLFSEDNQDDGPVRGFIPGVLAWAGFLASANGGRRLSHKNTLQIHGIGFEYGKQSSSIVESIDDAVLLSSFLLSPEGAPLVALACNCVDNTDKAVSALGSLATNLLIAAGGDQAGTTGLNNKAKAEAYFELDSLFRSWLASLGDGSNPADVRTQWNSQARELLNSRARGYVVGAGPKAVTGALKKGSRGMSDVWVTAAKAEAWFHAALKKALPLESDIERKEDFTDGKLER